MPVPGPSEQPLAAFQQSKPHSEPLQELSLRAGTGNAGRTLGQGLGLLGTPLLTAIPRDTSGVDPTVSPCGHQPRGSGPPT